MMGVLKICGRMFGAMFKLLVVVVILHYLNSLGVELHSQIIMFVVSLCWVFSQHITDYRLYKLEKELGTSQTKCNTKTITPRRE